MEQLIKHNPLTEEEICEITRICRETFNNPIALLDQQVERSLKGFYDEGLLTADEVNQAWEQRGDVLWYYSLKGNITSAQRAKDMGEFIPLEQLKQERG